MSSVTLENAQAHLSELIGQLQPGETVVIMRGNRPVARLIAETAGGSWPCKAGSYKKDEFWMAPDFDAPLDDFWLHSV